METSCTPTPPPSQTSMQPDTAAISKAVQEQFERERGYLKFAQEQAEKDRAYFKHLFDRAIWFLGVLILAAGILFWRSVDQLRDDVKASAAVAVTKAQADVTLAVDSMKSVAQKELDAVRNEVRKRVSDEFETEQITNLVRAVAKDRSEKEFRGIIRLETSRQVAKGIRDEALSIQGTVQDETRRAVRELQPTISGIVEAETRAQVDKSVVPIQNELRDYGRTIKIGALATLARSDDRRAFDQLKEVVLGTSPASDDERRIAESTVTAIRSGEEQWNETELQFRQAAAYLCNENSSPNE